jgi:starch phosphorylase
MMQTIELPSADGKHALYDDKLMWARKAILNVASSGRFSRDRTIREYANDIWRARPSPVP